MNFNSNELLHTLDFKVKQVFVHQVFMCFVQLREMEYIFCEIKYSVSKDYTNNFKQVDILSDIHLP